MKAQTNNTPHGSGQTKEPTAPISIKDLEEILSITIKEDKTNKVITFLAMLLNYTNEDQMNIAFASESSTGKSYIPLQIAAYFPIEDVMERAYSSPTAFYHDEGEWNRELKIISINLAKKILIFLDQPHDSLLHRLRSLLSHDKRKLIFKITDRTAQYGLKTKTVVIRGFPTVIFCSARYSMDDQERTRMLVLSPEKDQEKLESSIDLLAEKLSDRKKYTKELKSNARRKWLKDRVKLTREANVEEIIIKHEDKEYMLKRFYEEHPNLIPRYQRDFPRLIALAKAHALLNLFSRKRSEDGHSITATREDIEVGYELYRQISEANELGLPPEVYNIYQKVLKPNLIDEGILLKEFDRFYYKVYHKPLGIRRRDNVLNLLCSAALVLLEPDPHDRRYYRIYPPVMCYLSQTELNAETDGSIQRFI